MQIVWWVKDEQKIDTAVAEAFLDSSDSRNYRCAVISVYLPTHALRVKASYLTLNSSTKLKM